MICAVCGKLFAPRLTFDTIISPRPICRECQRRFQPLERIEAIPTRSGLLQIESLFEGKNADNELENRLWNWCHKPLKRALSQRRDYDLLLWYDGEIELMFPIWLRLFEPLGTIRIIALFEPQIPRVIESD